MIAIFSEQWFDELDAALAASPNVPADASIRIHYRIVTDDDPIAYTIVIDDGTAGVEVGADDRADVVFEQTIATAIELATGQLTSHEAFMAGRLRVSGDSRKLVAVATGWLDDAQAKLRPRTDYSAPGP